MSSEQQHYFDTTDENDSSSVMTTTAPLWVWIGLTAIAALSFWTQATVTEERFVPALNVIAIAFRIPDDIAGATLMASGASSPELFSSFVALFITHSALGLGTIVGSEIFNQLIICAGAVFSSKTSGKLELDRAVVIREVGFYALSIMLLYVALRDTRPDPDDPSGVNHIYISFGDACMVFSGYILYVLVCAQMDGIVQCCVNVRPRFGLGQRQATKTLSYGSTDHRHSKRADLDLSDNIPFLREVALKREPAGNFESVKLYRTKMGERAPSIRSSASQTEPSLIARSIKRAMGAYSDGRTLRLFEFLLNTEKPSDERDLYDMEVNQFEDRLSCFMWQRSYFYNKARFATRGWHLRWFTSTAKRIYSVPDRTDYERHRVKYPIFKEIEVDEKRLIIRIINPEQGKRDFYLMAPSKEILIAVVEKMEAIIDANEADQVQPLAMEDKDDYVPDFIDGDAHQSLVDFPASGSNLEIILFVILLPLRLLMHWTLPDVRNLDQEGNPVSPLSKAYLAVGSCLLWLIVGSYAMVSSLEHLAALMDIPDAVVGVTVSAAGTSLPNYVASKVAAQRGFGNMAVSNAFGSNTFNIMIGLGLPWVLYTSFGTGFKPYHGLRDEGITQSVLILGTVLLIFVILIIPSNFTLYRWHGWLFIFLYVAYLTYAIGSVYW